MSLNISAEYHYFGIILLQKLIMSTTGLVGAAAITATLSLLGPGGMIGGIITLIVIGAGSSLIAKYGYSAIIMATCKKIMQKENLTEDQMCEKIEKYPITKALKEKIKAKIREATKRSGE
ncbi:MAG: hypothetical protein IJ530_07895 [Treponema sp.]|nr:hypothetical protein [Treponema sp.]